MERSLFFGDRMLFFIDKTACMACRVVTLKKNTENVSTHSRYKYKK